MAKKRTSLKMLRKQAIEGGKRIFKKLAENDKAEAVLMLFPDGNVRIKLVIKQGYAQSYYLNVKEPEELEALGEIIQELVKSKQLMNLLRENESWQRWLIGKIGMGGESPSRRQFLVCSFAHHIFPVFPLEFDYSGSCE